MENKNRENQNKENHQGWKEEQEKIESDLSLGLEERGLTRGLPHIRREPM